MTVIQGNTCKCILLSFRTWKIRNVYCFGWRGQKSTSLTIVGQQYYHLSVTVPIWSCVKQIWWMASSTDVDNIPRWLIVWFNSLIPTTPTNRCAIVRLPPLSPNNNRHIPILNRCSCSTCQHKSWDRCSALECLPFRCLGMFTCINLERASVWRCQWRGCTQAPLSCANFFWLAA